MQKARGTYKRTLTFGGLILAQAAHSAEECFGRLWETFPPARFVAGLASSNLERGFVTLNVLLIVFGVWCLLWPVQRGWTSMVWVLWLWITIEVINGVVHPLWSLLEGGYTPGVATAPVLLVLAVYLAIQLRGAAQDSEATK